jgi:Domain of unknown function (DUF4178)
MQQYACPNCGAPVVFRSSISVQTTCTYCRSMIVRHDMNLETLGQVAELLDDMSPFQVGTSGRYMGKGFTLVGRVKVIYEKGTWSEWFALFDDGTEGWLAEAQGSYMMTYEQHDAEVSLPQELKPTEEVVISGTPYEIEDVREVTYFASEGELPFAFTPKTVAISMDLKDDRNSMASISILPRGTIVYLGYYLDFDRCQFQNLRMLDGW